MANELPALIKTVPASSAVNVVAPETALTAEADQRDTALATCAKSVPLFD